MPIRFSHLVRPDSIDEKSDRPPRTDDEFHNAKIELTNFYQDIILILDDAVKKNVLSESNQKDIALAEKDSALAEKDSALAEKDSALAEKDEFIRLIIAERDEKDAKLQRLLGRKKHTSRRRR